MKQFCTSLIASALCLTASAQIHLTADLQNNHLWRGMELAFLQLHNLVIETYQNRQAAMAYGAIDHIAIDVKNIDELFKVVQRAGLKMLDTKVNGLPFWENGVKFFTIEGPNNEKIEFCEKL